MQFEDRVRAVAEFGFTERQARFLVNVMLHSGVCLLRQYSSFADIVHGQKTRKFFFKLVRLRYASAYPCRHNRARVYQVHHKALYRAIGQTDSRHRRPLSPSRVVEGLMLLDALVAEPEVIWLATDEEKAAHLTVLTRIDRELLPHPTVGEPGSSEVQLFPDKCPIGIDLRNGRAVFLYLAAESHLGRFHAFLQRHFEVLRILPAWTLRVVVPPWPMNLGEHYLKAAHDDLTVRLSPASFEALRWYFNRCQRMGDKPSETLDQERFDYTKEAFNTPRYHLLYRRWLTDGDRVFDLVSSGGLSDAIERGAGRIESLVLPHSYRHLSPLVNSTVRMQKGAEEGDTTASRPRPLPHVATPCTRNARAMQRSAASSTCEVSAQ